MGAPITATVNSAPPMYAPPPGIHGMATLSTRSQPPNAMSGSPLVPPMVGMHQPVQSVVMNALGHQVPAQASPPSAQPVADPRLHSDPWPSNMGGGNIDFLMAADEWDWKTDAPEFVPGMWKTMTGASKAPGAPMGLNDPNARRLSPPSNPMSNPMSHPMSQLGTPGDTLSSPGTGAGGHALSHPSPQSGVEEKFP